MIEIYDSEGTLKCSFRRVLSATLSDKLSGEETLSFSVLASRSQPLSVGMIAKLNGQFFNIVRVSKKISGGFPITTAQCEHITYLLNEEQYNLVTFVFEGTPTEGVTQLLSGTPFSVGRVDVTERVECAFTDESPLSRRSALMKFIDACGCEVEYDGYKINMRKHRGSATRKSLMDGENVTDLAVTIDSREGTQSYEISLFKLVDLQAGDEVNITYTPMGVNVDTRIISIEYDPFYRYTVRVEVGDYVPNLLVSTVTKIDEVKQEFKAADGKLLSNIQTVEGNVSTLTQTMSGFETRIQTIEGNVSTLTQTVSKFETRIQTVEGNLSTLTQTVNKFETRIKSVEGSVSTLTQNVSSLTTRIETAEGSISTLTQTVSGFKTRVESVEGSVSTLTQTVSGLTTRIETAEGNISTVTQDVSSLTTRIETAEGNISTVTQTANKIDWIVASGTSSSDFTMTDRAIKLVADTIDLSGYVTISSLETAGQTTINGSNITTGTIQADRIDTSSLKVKTIYASSGKVSLKEYATSSMYIGGDGSWNYDYTCIFAGTQIKFGSYDGIGSNALIMETTKHCLRPSTYVDWDLGSSTYPFGTLYCSDIQMRNETKTVAQLGYNSGSFECLFLGTEDCHLGSSSYYWDIGYVSKIYLASNCYLSADSGKLCVNGTAIGGADTNMAGKAVNMGGSTSYYIIASTSRELKPSASSTSYPFYLGTSSLYWQYAYIGSTQVKIGSSSYSKIGFFAGTPITRQTLSTYSQNMGYSSATSSNYLKVLNNVVGILSKYGLIGT